MSNVQKEKLYGQLIIIIKKEMIFLLTSKASRDFYYLYEVLDTRELKKLGRASSPLEIEKKFNVKSRMLT